MNYNIITVSFGALRKITGPSVSYQYDAVQYLVIRDLELPAAYRVDFCNDGDTSTISMSATDDGVLIPDQLLATGKNIKAYIVLNGTDEGAVETRYEITLPVNKRPAPSDIEPTPAEQQQIDELIEQLSDALEKSVPAGGLAGQVLAKATDDDYDLEWVDQSGGGEGGTTNYNRLTNKPQINGVELEGNQSAADLGLATPSDIPTVPVQSVAGKTGAVTLEAGDIGFDDTQTYAVGSIGAEVSAQKNAISQLDADSIVYENLTNTGTYTISANDLESGQWSYSQKADNTARARTKFLIPVYAGMSISYENTTFDVYFGVLETPTSMTYLPGLSGWKTDSNGVFNITADGYLTFVIRNHADTTAIVNPADFDSVVTINTVQKNAIDAKQDATSYVTLSGTIVTQTGADNTMYLCGELAELTFTAPATGQTAIRFTSGTTPTVATFSGVTWLNGFDPTAIEASKTYEINILNGLGCAAWT